MTNGSGEYRPEIIDVMKQSKPEELARLKIRLEREQQYFAGKPMPDRLLLAWHAYLFGYAHAGGISIPDYEQLEAMLPPLSDPVPTPIEELAEGRIFEGEDLGDADPDDSK